MSGYYMYSKSNRAVEAESNYRFSRTVLCRLLGLKPKAVLDLIEPCEWHHTSKEFNSTDYYDSRDCISSRILRTLTKPRPNQQQLDFRATVRMMLIKELKSQRRANAGDRKKEQLRNRECQILLNASQYRGLAIAGKRAGKRSNTSTAAHLAFELTYHGSLLRDNLPDYMLSHYERKCPNLLSLCLKATDYLSAI